MMWISARFILNFVSSIPMNNRTGKNCNVCGSPLPGPIYDSQSDKSLTSLCQLRPGKTEVYYCAQCGHILTNPIEDIGDYYAHDYKILLNEDDEDQIYEEANGEVIYRTTHQLRVINRKLSLNTGQKILDYGCAKASMATRLLEQLPGLDFHFFDVSEMYRRFWEQLTTPDKCAVDHTPAQWVRRFDVITSFFSLEHIADPRNSARHIHSMLKNDGVFYAVVPDTFGNAADFVVVDHVNHFTASSVTRLLCEAGFCAIDVDPESHRGALTIVAQKSGVPTMAPVAPPSEDRITALAKFWSGLAGQIAAAEDGRAGLSAIYGSGFYGSFIYSLLKFPQAIEVFLDQSPFQQGRRLFDIPIVAPGDLSNSIQTLFVGLNPTIAREIIYAQPHLNRPGLRHIFLDAPSA